VLLELRVKNLGIIEDIDWQLEKGLNVITGETGAGKSLIIDAVELLLNASASEEVIRHDSLEAVVEGIFALTATPGNNSLKMFLLEKGLTTESDDTLIIKCEIRRQRPLQVRINGHVTPKTLLRQIGQMLIDIHGQSQHLSLLDNKYHLYLLDSYAGLTSDRRKFTEQAVLINQIKAELATLQNRDQENARQVEFLNYQVDEISQANLQPEEEADLEKEKSVIVHSEKLKELSALTYQTLTQNESSRYNSSVLAGLHQALQAMKKLVDLDPAMNSQMDTLDKTYYSLEETAREIQNYGESLNFDPQRLEEIENRLELIHDLKRKYGKTIPDILGYLEKASQELQNINNSSQNQENLSLQLNQLKKDAGMAAEQLSIKRQQAAEHLAADVCKELSDLNMGQMQFKVGIDHEIAADGIPGHSGANYAYSADGIDTVEFIVSTNPGEPLLPLARIASTGEISRFTLALKGALRSADSVPVLIFDEVDIGVGGRSGDIIGKKIWSLARQHQVICITHLPQIAVYADAHFGVHKETFEGRTTSHLEHLDEANRLSEIALMLAGKSYTETALQNARELMNNAGTWKKGIQPAPVNPIQLKF
jgi:DNA repair protein RecN (Recombination protein N)